MEISRNDVTKDITISFENKDLPVLYDCDAVVVGGSFAGISAARKLAESGKSVVVIESRTYLGREVTATLRPWLDVSSNDFFTEVIERVSDRGVQNEVEIALYMDHVKTSLEDLLLEQQVKILYAAFPTQLVSDPSGKKLLVIGNKSGRQVIRATIVIDATDSSSVLRLAGEKFEVEYRQTSHFLKTIEMYRATELTESEIHVPEEIGIDGNVVSVHKGYLGNGHVLLEFQLTMKNKEQRPIDRQMKDEIASRHVMMKVAEHLIQHHAAFENAYLAASSYELTALEFPSLSHNFKKENADYLKGLADYASSDPLLWCLNESARVEKAGKLFSNPVTSSLLGEKVAEQLVKKWNDITQSTSQAFQMETEKERSESLYKVAELNEPQSGRTYKRQRILGLNVPVIHSTDVLVVGGGTSGATAAITSAEEGMDTLLLEMNPGLGGTGTLGGVDSYWFGRRLGYSNWITEKVNEVQKRLKYQSPKWNIEAKMYALLNEAEQAGVTTYFYTTTIATIMDKNRVRGVVVASKFGTFAVLAETVIDATGDGDIAAFAGADYIYGSERDHIVMWYSLAQFAKPGRSQNNFTSMVHISNIEDYTRAIIDGRRRKRKRDIHDHGIYVASRETRHILGEEVMTLTDQLRYRQWDDVINIHFSNHDMKGKNGADWMHLGLIPPNLEIEIPYKILLPNGLEGILIAGKAISVTHDAFAAIRMQSDLENLGGIVALAAAQAVRHHQVPREINIKQLQKRIIEEGLLPEEILTRTVENKVYLDEELEALVDSLTGEEPLYLYADMEVDEVYTDRLPIVEICMAGPRIIPYLESALDGALEEGNTKRQIALAQALSMYESSYGVPILIKEIERMLGDEGLPHRDNGIRHTQLPPDQGAMPDVVYYIYTLGMTRDKRSIPVWQKIADRIDPSEKSLKDMLTGTFYYVDAVCYGIERLADPDCIPILESFYHHDNLTNQLRKDGVVPDYFKERQAMLDLSIARALASCGSEYGFRILVDYLTDSRSLLAEHAHEELKRITKKDFKKIQQDWIMYLEQLSEGLNPEPVTMKLDM
ncbi:FAD-dependent oxidoreductase [Metabacillus halosaccharovorans]|uniref:FAD-dependent oxidoreductase n=1 Tax=Metabacillus halosaccharovorans TaxID=930124 RepID=UPI00203BB4C7|nr:FAD-dependent oxidoreductase [Metabacillus halosaccharovorans]MCM3443504.1 FAD-dependent oxidoreductase [Metabacillus halosaccharovorans]